MSIAGRTVFISQFKLPKDPPAMLNILLQYPRLDLLFSTSEK